MDSIICANNRETGTSVAVMEQEPQFRVERVLDIKRQLAEGRYDVAARLDAVVDRLLEELL